MRSHWSVVLLIAVLGCGSEVPERDELSACNPFLAQPQPISIDGLIAAGKAPDGTVYVVSAGSKTEGQVVFVSEGDALVRRRLLGAGSSGTGEWTISFEDTQSSRLVFNIDNGTVTAMGLVHDGDRTFLNQLNGNFTPLSVLGKDALKDLKVRNLDGSIQLEHLAHADDGQQLLVTRPTDDWSYDDFRLFVGRDGKLDEQHVTRVSRGSATFITFENESGEWNAVFSSSLAPSIASTLSHGHSTLSLTLDDVTQGVPAGTTFRCLE